MGVLAASAGAIALIAVAVLAFVALVVIVVGPSRRVRAEPPMDPDVESALLLGEDPDEVAREEDAANRSPTVADDDEAWPGTADADQA